MSFWKSLTSEFIDIIEWLDDTQNTLVYRFERHDNEIKNGAKLIVREGQVAVFIKEGKHQRTIDMDILEPADTFEAGTYTLDTKNLPILSTLMGWKYGFDSPFKAEVYFINTRRFLDQKWGTPNPIILRDPEFQMVQIRAFGTFSYRINKPAYFLKEIVGTAGSLKTDDINKQLRDFIVSRFTDALGESRMSVLDMAAKHDELGEFVKEKIKGEFAELGVELLKIVITNINLPPELDEAFKKRSSMGILGNMQTYTQYQTAEAIGKAAEHGGSGIASSMMESGMGFAMGMNMANQMQNAQQQAPQPNAGTMPPPLPQAVAYHVAINGQTQGPFELPTLKQHVQSGHITRDTLVWKQGMANWTAAGQVMELSSLFGSVPPPLPHR
ncbi:putative virion core protein (lumpy skin disease virus) [Beggiatoa alba B18LD]|uniref:Putative virion core protein (Lumpy skin disease virus) n=1 Tax=Beggiatoa alba B18LD TaxID=395493 RepID=I3CBW5_9GAMM|nr:SPFH domain-containing protein [Beggiatoa alba]EIJ41108.1 putative virion core protein (lumpy skin disease virus) [Beggiatoa alba B18LD]